MTSENTITVHYCSFCQISQGMFLPMLSLMHSPHCSVVIGVTKDITAMRGQWSYTYQLQQFPINLNCTICTFAHTLMTLTFKILGEIISDMPNTVQARVPDWRKFIWMGLWFQHWMSAYIWPCCNIDLYFDLLASNVWNCKHLVFFLTNLRPYAFV